LRTEIGKGLVNRSLRYAADLGLIYLNNPKAGCSTIKFSLWTAIDDLTGKSSFGGNVHARKADPFARDVFALTATDQAKFSAASMFSVVRNPYSRILAAYLDKIPNDRAVWDIFHQSFGLKPDLTKEELSFGDFLRLIDTAPPDLLDGHFRLQTDNLLWPYSAPNFVGYLEDMRPVEQFLSSFGVVLRDHVRHATRSADLLHEYYDFSCSELCRKIYAEDFELLGYSTDFDEAKMPSRISSHRRIGRGDMDGVRRWATTGEPPTASVPDLPELRMFVRTPGRENKRKIIITALASDKDLSRLARYAKYARRRLEENELSDALLEKIASLRARYELAVRNPSIFLPMRRIVGRR
jgi:hypothetical protein